MAALTGLVLAAGAGLALAETGEGHTGTQQSSRLYTPPDPSATGGIAGRLAPADQPLLRVLALPTDDPASVYQGEVAADGRAFSFQGLPVAKYDLVLVLADEFREGLTLRRGENTLADRDRQAIRDKLMVSVPFFDTKEIHRCEGTTGREGRARCVLQEVRTRPVTLQDGSVHPELQIRSFKLVLVEDVGPGWHVVRTREIIRQEVAGNERKGVLPVRYDARLGGIRVVKTVKDIGTITR
jgi:hypothetical protein